MGTRRTLKCICQPCRGGVECVWTVANVVLKAAKGRGRFRNPAFLTNGKARTTKEVMVAAWNKLLMAGIKGHSPRRERSDEICQSWHADPGVGVSLGRWKSVAVLRYAEEALREVPANGRIESATAEKRNGSL